MTLLLFLPVRTGLVHGAPDDAGDGSKDPSRPAPAVKEGYVLDETVVVSGRRKEEAFRTDRSVSIVDRQTLFDDAPRTTPTAMRESPGVFVQETNYGGGSPIVRGMIGPQLLILVDGVRFNNAVYRTGPLQYLNLIDPLSLDRIEVLRGPGSVLYGSDAMGGVIEAFPTAPQDFRGREGPPASGRALFRYSSANRGLVGNGIANGGVGGFSALGGITYKAYEDVTAGRGGGVQPYSGYDNLSATASVTQRFPRWDFKLAYLFSRIPDAGRTDKLYDKQSLQIYDNEDHLVWGRVNVDIVPMYTRAGYTFSYQDFFERKDSISLADDLSTRLKTTRDEVTDQTMGHDLHFITRVLHDRLQVQYGLMWYRDWVDSDRRVREAADPWEPSAQQSYPEGSTYDNYGGFLLAQGDLYRTVGGHVIRLGGGYRLHAMAGHAPAQTPDLPAVNFSHSGNVFQASAQYLYRDLLNLALTFSQGFRAPNLQEAVQLGDTGKFFHVPNDNLAPESSNTVEWLTRLKVWRLTASGTLYVSFIDDLIKRERSTWQGQSQVDGKDVWKNVNGANGLIWGAEGYLYADLGYGLSLRGNITYTWGEEFVTDAPNVPLSRIPPLFGTAILRYATGGKRWTGFAESSIRAAARQVRLSPEDEDDVRIPPGGTPGWWTWNLRLGVETDYHFRVSLVAENLLDKLYKYHASGIYATGVNVMLTLEAFL